MIVGVPKEIKDNEYRVAMTPAGVEVLRDAGHPVLVQKSAGEGSGFSDEQYETAGATVVANAAEVFASSDMVVKVKEPLPQEYDRLRSESLLFTYLHLAACPVDLVRILLERRITAVGYETVEEADGTLPLLVPMSQVAGRMAVQVAAHYLQKDKGGLGKLLGGIPGVEPCHIVILGSGVVAEHAAQMALGMGAKVTLIARNSRAWQHLSEVFHSSLVTLALNPQNIRQAVKSADVVISGVLSPGGKAPKLVTRGMIETMKPGSVIVDVSVDQGGCFETTRPTSHSEPTYVEHSVVHYCVANMPGVVPHTSAIGLTNATLPYVLRLANDGMPTAVKNDGALAKGVNTYKGYITYRAVAEAFDMEYKPLESLW